MKYVIVSRSQGRKGGRRGFGGPDRYAMLLAVPEGVEVPSVLNRARLARLGIEIEGYGEYYSQHGYVRGLAAQVNARLEARKAELESK